MAGATCGEWSESRQAAASPWSVGYYPVRRRAAPYIPQRRDVAQPPPSHLLFHPPSSPHHTFRLLLSVRSFLTSVRVWFTTTHSAICTLHSAICTLHSALCTLHSTLSSVAKLGSRLSPTKRPSELADMLYSIRESGRHLSIKPCSE